MGTRYICVHGHFHQQPREGPWLESIELQDSACPYRRDKTTQIPLPGSLEP